MSKEKLQGIINDFNPDKFGEFFREKNRNFSRTTEKLSQYNDDRFTACTKIGEINFESDNIFFVLIKSKNDLTEKTIKKLQYDKAKKILKDQQADSGIFVFYDAIGSFRFSLVYADYTGKREWSSFKRFTYFVKEGLTNKTFLHQIGDLNFDSLKNIKDAFSVEKVTKEFYRDIANWYFWAVDNCKFPDSAEEIENGRNIAVIRLITRMIFIWFMKELKLIPENLFQKSFAKDIIKDISEGDSSYYKAVLQNLFFATLSTPKEQRQFADETKHHKGHNDDFGNQSVFRFHELFNKPDELKSYFNDIPYLNGGLFECLDKGKENYYIDGFTRRKTFQPDVPNYLFFSKEHDEDLNEWYGSKGKSYKVKGLLEILSSYNFTVDENTSDDADVALDPELLGKVFENLLASFNPETSTTARKATGSFYTPREIVDYMVTESLKEYFKTHLSEAENLDTNLDNLFNPLSHDNPFVDNSYDTKKLVNLIENVRIVDPAVGSGAFPMGILNKLVFILNKIDKGNKLWKEAQLKSVSNIQDSRLREQTISHIENYFENKNPDYGRKLYLIQRCIYGVDIQQIAVEISKLRFFISLLIDEKIDKSESNWNIEPLPNLDFKIMQGNSLLDEYDGIKLFDESLFEDIGTDRINQFNIVKRKQDAIQKEILTLNKEGKYTPELKREYSKKLEDVSKKIESLKSGKKTSDNIFDMFDTHKETNEKRDELTKLHREYFEINIKSEKDIKKKKIEKLEWELIESTLISQGKHNKLDDLDKIRKSNSKPFFLWKLHFPEVFLKGGFDIVIGNPPYGIVYDTVIKSLYEFKYSSFKRNNDIYIAFVEASLNILRNNGTVILITPNTFLNGDYFKSIRKYLRENSIINHFVDFKNSRIFQDPTVFVSILSANKALNVHLPYQSVLKLSNEDFSKSENNIIAINQFDDSSFKPSNEIINSIFDGFNQKDYFLLNDKYNVKDIGFNYWSIGKGKKRDGNSIGDRIFYSGEIKNKMDKAFLKGKNIDKYIYSLPSNYLRFNYEDYLVSGVDIFRYSVNFLEESPKIIYRQTSNKLIAALDYNKHYCDKTVHVITPKSKSDSLVYLVALLNSRLFDYFYKYISQEKEGRTFAQVKTIYLKKLPILNLNANIIHLIETIVGYIILLKKNNIPSSSFFEQLIDAIVYELYLPKDIKLANSNIIEYLLNIVSNIKESNEEANQLNLIEKVYIKLTEPKSIIRERIVKQNEEVRVIRFINHSLK